MQISHDFSRKLICKWRSLFLWLWAHSGVFQKHVENTKMAKFEAHGIKVVLLGQRRRLSESDESEHEQLYFLSLNYGSQFTILFADQNVKFLKQIIGSLISLVGRHSLDSSSTPVRDELAYAASVSEGLGRIKRVRGVGEQRKIEEQDIRCFVRLKNGPPCSRLVFVLLIAVVLEMTLLCVLQMVSTFAS